MPSVAVAPSSPSGRFGGAESVFHWRAHCCWHPAPPLPSDSLLFGPLLSLLELVLPCYLWTIWHWSCFEQKEHTLVYPLPLLQQEVFKTQEASHLGFPMPSPHHVHIIKTDQAVVPAPLLDCAMDCSCWYTTNKNPVCHPCAVQVEKESFLFCPQPVLELLNL